MKALVTGAAGFIGSHLGEGLVRRARRDRRRLLHRLLRPRAQRRNLAALSAALHAGRARLRRRTWRAARGRHARVPPGGAAGRARSWGAEFATYARHNVLATQRLLEALQGRPVERWCRPRARRVRRRRADADPRRRPADAALALRRDQARRRAPGASSTRNFGVPAVGAALLHGVRSAAAPGHGLPSLPRARRWRARRSSSTATASRHATSPSSPTRSRRNLAAAAKGVPGRAYNIGGGSRVSVNHVLETIAQITKRPLDIRPASLLKKATCETRRPTRREPGWTLDSCRRTSLADGLAAEYRLAHFVSRTMHRHLFCNVH